MDNEERMAIGATFDANGHRIKRNAALNHRNRPKVRQPNPEGYHFHAMIPLEDYAKALKFCSGKVVDSTPKRGCKVRKPTRPMTVGDLVREYIHCLVERDPLEGEFRDWYDAQHAEALGKRMRADAMIATGINRIPKELQMKRGLGAESHKAAMAALAAASEGAAEHVA